MVRDDSPASMRRETRMGFRKLTISIAGSVLPDRCQLGAEWWRDAGSCDAVGVEHGKQSQRTRCGAAVSPRGCISRRTLFFSAAVERAPGPRASPADTRRKSGIENRNHQIARYERHRDACAAPQRRWWRQNPATFNANARRRQDRRARSRRGTRSISSARAMWVKRS